MNHEKMDSREVGLLIGLHVERYFFETDDLHYGYWPPGLAVSVKNWAQAQANHSELILQNIPEGVRTILDVGCGAGAFTQKLLDRGYRVDAVSPSPLLAREARARLGDRCRVFETKLEHLETDARYDLVLFSESFQYVGLGKSLPRVARILNPGGHLLICDFFRKEQQDEGVLGGGHKLEKFFERMKAQPFEPVRDLDITNEVAPTMDLINDFLLRVGAPGRDLVFALIAGRYPLLYRFLNWKYGRKLRQVDQKYFQGLRDAENFKRCKSYRLFLYRRREDRAGP